MSEDFYSVLGVSRDASEEEIQQAFRQQAAEYHPDVSDDPDAEEKFKKAKKAKEVLTDDEKRRMYDQLGHDQFVQAEKHGATDGDRGGAGAGPGGMGGMGGGNPFGGGGGGGMGDIFEQFFGGGRGGGGPQQGQDLRTRLEVTLEEAYRGVTKQMTVTRPQRCDTCDGAGHPPDADVRQCPECGGRGQVTRTQQTPLGRVQQTSTCPRCEGEGELYSEQCPDCDGSGIVQERSTIDVDVPAGIRDGQSLRLDGEGAPGDPRAPDGDLLVEIAVEDHPDFDRDGDDLHTRAAVSFPQATFGTSVEVETLDGTVEMDVPAGTQSGERFRLDGRGMPRVRGRGQGDLYVTVQVVTPRDVNEEQREALEQFAEAGGEEVDVERGFFERLKSTL